MAEDIKDAIEGAAPSKGERILGIVAAGLAIVGFLALRKSSSSSIAPAGLAGGLTAGGAGTGGTGTDTTSSIPLTPEVNATIAYSFDAGSEAVQNLVNESVSQTSGSSGGSGGIHIGSFSIGGGGSSEHALGTGYQTSSATDLKDNSLLTVESQFQGSSGDFAGFLDFLKGEDAAQRNLHSSSSGSLNSVNNGPDPMHTGNHSVTLV